MATREPRARLEARVQLVQLALGPPALLVWERQGQPEPQALRASRAHQVLTE
jgi:hypothetical protein